MSTNYEAVSIYSKAYTCKTYISKQLLYNVWLARNSRSLNSILEQLVLLGKGNGLLPALVFALYAGCDLTEEDEFMALQSLVVMEPVGVA